MSKLFYIGYIRVFLFKYEEYIRDNSEKLNKPIEVINSINEFNNPISFIIELYFYKVIYNKNNKDINIFSPENNKYNLKSLNNFKDFFSLQINDDNSAEENENNEDFINLLEEKTTKLKNSNEEYRFNQYFYYSDYIDEKYLTSIFNNESRQTYPVLSKYLELKNNNLLNDFYSYHNALFLLNEEYSNKITREFAKKETLDKLLIFKRNKDLFNKFFHIYNKMTGNNDDNDNIDDDNINDDIERDNTINNNLNQNLPLYKFLIVD